MVEEGLGGQVQMRRWCFFTCPCSDCNPLWKAAPSLALGMGPEQFSSRCFPALGAKPTLRPGPSPARYSRASSSPARQRPTACCHCSLGSSGPRPAAAGTAGPLGEPARQGGISAPAAPADVGGQGSVQDPGFGERLERIKGRRSGSCRRSWG